MDIMLKFRIIALVIAALYLLDANPSLYIADIIVRSRPSILQHKFNNTVTLITGASDGIGAETALQLCGKTNTKIILLARTSKKLEVVKEKCSELAKTSNSGAVAVTVTGDVTKGEKQMTKWIQTALKQLGRDEVDIAFVNAGRTQRSPAKETDEDVVRSILELNVIGAVSTAKAVMSTFQETYKKESPVTTKQFIVIASVAGKMPVPLQSAYSASKAALIYYFDSLRAEHPEIRVTTVCAGPVGTDIASNAFGSSLNEKPKVEAEKIENKMPVKRSVDLILAGSVMNPFWLFHELWFSPQPILSYVYGAQYLPDLMKLLGSVIGPKRVETWRKGESIY